MKIRKVIKVSIFFLLFLVLTASILTMPAHVGTDVPSYNEATRYYLEHAANETGSVNIIAAILADYRAFDTLGETIVLFTSIVAVVSILKPTKVKLEEVKTHE